MITTDKKAGAVVTANIHGLAYVLAKVSCAADDTNSRYTLSCVRLEFRGKELTAVATDGRQLAYATVELIDGAADDVDLMLPITTVREIIKRETKGAQPTATIVVDSIDLPRIVSIKWLDHKRQERSVEFHSLEGRFPSWRDVLPKRQDGNNEAAVLTASAKTFVDSFSRVHDNVATLFDTGKLQLSKAIVKLPKKTKQFEGIEKTGADIVFAWDIDFPIAWLNTLPETCPVSFHIESPNKAILGVCDNVNAFYVVMPMSIEN